MSTWHWHLKICFSFSVFLLPNKSQLNVQFAEVSPWNSSIANRYRGPQFSLLSLGIHYRTKRNFRDNLKIIINVNKALTDILQEMRGRMKKIDSNLVKVKKNLEYLEEMYEGIFRKVNRLLVAWLMFEINYTYYLMQNI